MGSFYNEHELPLCLEEEPLLDEFVISLLCLIILWILEIIVRSILSFLKLQHGNQKIPEDYEPILEKEEVIRCVFGCLVRGFVCFILVYKFNEFSISRGWEICSCADIRALVALLSYLLVFDLLRLPSIGWVQCCRDCLFLLFYLLYFSDLAGTVSSYFYGLVFIVTFAESCRFFVQFLLFLSQVLCLSNFWKYLILALQCSISISLGVLVWFCWVQWLSNFEAQFAKWFMPFFLTLLTVFDLWCSYLIVLRFVSLRRGGLSKNSGVARGNIKLSIRKNQQITINPKYFNKSSIQDKAWNSYMQSAISESNISGSNKLFSLEEVLISKRGSRISKSWNRENQDAKIEMDILPCLYPASEYDSVTSTPIAANDKIRRHNGCKSTSSTPIKWSQTSSKGVSRSKIQLGYTNMTGVNSVNKILQSRLIANAGGKIDGFALDQGKRPSYFLIKGSGNSLPGRLVPIKAKPVTPEVSTSHFQKVQEKFQPTSSQNTSKVALLGSTDYSEDRATLATGDEDFEVMSDDFNFNVLYPFGEKAVPTESNVTNQFEMGTLSSASILDFSSEMDNSKRNAGKGRTKNDMLELVPPNKRRYGRKTPHESEKSRMTSDDSVLCAFNTKLPKQLQHASSVQSYVGKRDRNDISVSALSYMRGSANKSKSVDLPIGRINRSEITMSSKSVFTMDVQNFDSFSEERSSGCGNVIRIDSSIEFEQKMHQSPIKRRVTLTPTTGSL